MWRRNYCFCECMKKKKKIDEGGGRRGGWGGGQGGVLWGVESVVSETPEILGFSLAPSDSHSLIFLGKHQIKWWKF